jgi:hypothetical protein
MADPIALSLDALEKYAGAVDKLGDDFGSTRQRLYDADVTEDSFGMLDASREIAEVYEQRTTDGLDALESSEELFVALSDAFKELRKAYEDVDVHNAKNMGGS